MALATRRKRRAPRRTLGKRARVRRTTVRSARRAGRVATKRKFAIPVITGLALLPGVLQALEAPTFKDKLNVIGRVYTGVDSRDGSFDIQRLKSGLAPFVGIIVIAGALKAMFGLRSKIPFVSYS